MPRIGIQPRYSGLRVQGTASSPSSAVSILMVGLVAQPCQLRPLSAYGGNARISNNCLCRYEKL